jgi:hypothetical protein
MGSDRISVPYNCDLKPLEDLLAGVRRPGDFFVEGSMEPPMPRVEVEGVGLLSFPVPQTLIEQHGLDMTHVTERKGSPQTLVCTKTRRTYQLQCEQHQADCVRMRALLAVMQPAANELSPLMARLAAAKDLKPRI